jgi:hypothetical protein
MRTKFPKKAGIAALARNCTGKQNLHKIRKTPENPSVFPLEGIKKPSKQNKTNTGFALVAALLGMDALRWKRARQDR